MYQFLAIPNKMNITLFLSSLFFVLDEFPEWECKEAIDFILDKQYSVSALCPLQCDNKIQKLSANALKKMSEIITDIELDNQNEQTTSNILYTLIIIICVQTMFMLACGITTWRIYKTSKNSVQEDVTKGMTEINEMKNEPLTKEESVESSIKEESV